MGAIVERCSLFAAVACRISCDRCDRLVSREVEAGCTCETFTLFTLGSKGWRTLQEARHRIHHVTCRHGGAERACPCEGLKKHVVVQTNCRAMFFELWGSK